MDFIDITSQRFGRWKVIEYAGDRLWRCRCDCGTKRAVHGKYLRTGRSKSCGCAQPEAASKFLTTHGRGYEDPTYCAWRAMNNRCNNPNARNYKWYGGRGIRVCKRWQSFENFLADMGEKPHGLTLDRINGNRNYAPSNCRWATWTQQANNRR